MTISVSFSGATAGFWRAGKTFGGTLMSCQGIALSGFRSTWEIFSIVLIALPPFQPPKTKTWPWIEQAEGLPLASFNERNLLDQIFLARLKQETTDKELLDFVQSSPAITITVLSTFTRAGSHLAMSAFAFEVTLYSSLWMSTFSIRHFFELSSS